MDMSKRVENAHWNPGLGHGTGEVQTQSVSSDTWSPIECLTSGMIPQSVSSIDGQLALFGNNLMVPRFQQRFAHSSLHFSHPHTTSVINAHPHVQNSSDIHLNISQHHMVESGGMSVPESLPEQQSTQNMSLVEHGSLDECNEDEEEDEDDEDEDESEDEISNGYMNQSSIPHDQSRMNPMSHSGIPVEENPLPSCRQQQMSAMTEVNLMGAMDDAPHVHAEEIPAMSQGHPLNSNPISAIPMITGNCNSMLMSNENESVTSVVTEESNNGHIHTNQHSDNTNYNGAAVPPTDLMENSVHGKMFVDGRLVFQLKKWSDEGFRAIGSCRHMDTGKSTDRCGLCHAQLSSNNCNQKDIHRHGVRGSFVVFGDCIVLELFPEHFNSGEGSVQQGSVQDVQQLDPAKAISIGNDKNDHQMSGSVYLGHSALNLQSQQQPLSEMVPGPSPGKSGNVNSQSQEQSWWDDFETNRSGRENDGQLQHSDLMNMHHSHPSNCISNPKLTAQTFHSQLQSQEAEIHDKPYNDASTPPEQSGNFQDFEKSDSKCSTTDDIHFASSSREESSAEESQRIYPEEDSQKESDEESGLTTHSVDCEDNQSSDIPLRPQVEHKVQVISKLNCFSSKNSQVEKGSSIKGNPKSRLKSKAADKYPCPSCKKSFNLKRVLKQHLEEKHGNGNPFQCTKCKMQYTDHKRFQRHSCTLSVEAIEIRLNKKSSTMEKANSISIPSNELLEVTYLDDDNDNNSTISVGSSSNDLMSVKAIHEDPKPKFRTISISKSSPVVVSMPSVSSSSTSSSSSMSKANLDFKVKVSSKPAVSAPPKKRPKILEDPGPDNSKSTVESDEYEEDTQQPVMANLRINETLINSLKYLANSEKNKGYKCNVCGKCFTVERRLLNHQACHNPERSSECEICGKKFQRKDKLMRHMYVHSEEKMFACDICEKRFSRRDKLSDHLKSHQTDEVHNCPMCEKQFARPDILKQHVKLHQMYNKHQCPDCLRFVTGKERLEQHMKRHKEAKALGETLLCPLCTKYFIQRQSLKAHIKKFHAEEFKRLNQLDGDCLLKEQDAVKSEQDDDSQPASDATSQPLKVSTQSSLTLGTSKKSEKTEQNAAKDKNKHISPVGNGTLKKYSCKMCLQKFSEKPALEKHIESKHSSKANLECTDTSTKASKSSSSKLKPNPVTKEKKGADKTVTVNNKKTKGATVPAKISTSSSIGDDSPTSSISTSTGSPSTSPPVPKLMSVTSILQQQQIRNFQQILPLQLPSCSSITNDLSFSVHQHNLQQQTAAQLNAYTHNLALANVARSTPNGTTVEDNQQLSSMHSLSSHPHSMTSQSFQICSPSPYFLNYSAQYEPQS